MKLHQLLAFEKDVRKRTQLAMTEVHRESKNDALMSGVSKRYVPADEAGMRYPDERKHVQLTATDAIDRFTEAWSEEVEVVSRKDWANLEARADLVVDGEALGRAIPATHLLFLEKHLEHVRTFLTEMAVLPTGPDWSFDEASGLHRTAESVTHRTEKTVEALVLLQPTKEHPGQAKEVVRDRVVGHWYTTLLSGAMTADRKRYLLGRLARLADAVKAAREQANAVEVSTAPLGEELLAYVFHRE